MINYFNDQVSENIQMLSDLEFIDKSLFDKLGKSELSDDAKKAIILKAYTYNSWIHNFETINIFYGDPTQRNHFKENEHKRNTGSTSGGPKFLTDEVAQNFINNIWNAEGKTYASRVVKEKGDPSYGIFTYDGTIESAVVKDVERPSQYLDQIEAGLREDYKRAGKTPEQIEKLIKKDRKPYEEMNEADGAGYISFDAYRTLKKLENAWSPQQENLFQKIIDGKEVKASDVLNFFPVYKLQNYGHLANDTLAPILACVSDHVPA
jgi:hypothetical protein